MKRSLGRAFPDQLKLANRSSRSVKIREGEWGEGWLMPDYLGERSLPGASPWIIVVCSLLVLISFSGLFLRLFHLQVVQGDYSRDLADSNRVQIRIIHAPRGVIYDRDNKVLAENNPGFRLKENFIPRDAALELEAKGDPKFNELELDTIRYYPQGEVTAHILGYVGQISETELKDLNQNQKQYRLGDRIGRAGIEAVYEDLLRGKDGAEIVEVDATGRKLRTLRKIDPIPGLNLTLSIDANLQLVAYNSLKKATTSAKSCCGALVVSDPQNGTILALVSIPSFDGNDFTSPNKQTAIQGYFQDPNSPLFNRAISGSYPPGSTFKIASALAGLRSGKISAKTQIEDTGIIKIGKFSYSNWFFTQYGKTEGLVDLTKALQRSNDIFFYRVGEMVGEVEMAKAAKDLGMGRKLGIDLPEEVEGIVPSDEWKRKVVGEVWYPGDSLHMAIGQGFILSTPLQILSEISTIASSGKLYQPFLVEKITRSDGSLFKEVKSKTISEISIKKEDLNLIKQGLSLATKPGGTAWPFANFSIPTSGKTGTAEFGAPQDEKNSSGQYKTHAWYVSFAPSDNPSIAAVVLVEAGGEGSSVAAPVAKEIYTWYFNGDKEHLKSLDLNPTASESAKYGE